jgi:hypothetical protein
MRFCVVKYTDCEREGQAAFKGINVRSTGTKKVQVSPMIDRSTFKCWLWSVICLLLLFMISYPYLLNKSYSCFYFEAFLVSRVIVTTRPLRGRDQNPGTTSPSPNPDCFSHV